MTKRLSGVRAKAARRVPEAVATVAPALPPEPIDTVDMTGGIVSEPMRQAYRDLRRGLQDTDRGAEAGAAYRKLKG